MLRVAYTEKVSIVQIAPIPAALALKKDIIVVAKLVNTVAPNTTLSLLFIRCVLEYVVVDITEDFLFANPCDI